MITRKVPGERQGSPLRAARKVATMAKITVPDVPAVIRESDDPVAQDMVSSLEGFVRIARACYATLDKYETQSDALAKRLEESDHDDVVAYRQAATKREQEAAKLAEAVKAAQEALKAYNDESDKELSEPLAKAEAAVRTSDDVTSEAMVKAVERIRAVAKSAKSNVDLLETFGIETGDFSIPVPATGKQSSIKDGETTFTPAFSKIVRDGKELDITKTFELAKLLKVQRDNITKAIVSAVGGKREGWDNLPVGAEVRFTLTINGTPTTIVVTKTIKGAAQATEEATEEASSEATKVEETTAA